MLKQSPVDVSTAIFTRGKFENPHVCDDQSAPIPSERDFDEPQVCDEGMTIHAGYLK